MRRNWLVTLALLVAVAGLIRGITAGALWDPQDTGVAELCRRLALNLLGAKQLVVAGAGVDNSLPIRADLGRGELPFTTVALGFRLFGLSEWAARLPLTVGLLGGLGALYAGVARLWDRRAALYCVLVLATTPLYFLQARVLFGDAMTCASFALAWSGLAVACHAEASGRARAGYGLLGVLGLYAGFWCRGPLVGVAVPALSVGLCGCLLRREPGAARCWARGSALLGLLALGLGLAGLSLAARTGEYSVFVGSALAVPGELPTFDVPLGALLHAAFPWSAAAPFALALVAGLGKAADGSLARRGLVLAATLTLALALAVSAWLGATLTCPPLPAVCCFAVLVAAALRELEDGRLEARLLGLLCAALALVIGFDLRTYPDKVLAAFGVGVASLPESFSAYSGRFWLVGACGLAALTALCCFEHVDAADADARPTLFRSNEYRGVLNALQQVWGGNLLFAGLVLEAALVGFLLLTAVSERLVHLSQLEAFGSVSRQLVAASAVVVPLLPLLPLLALLLRDVARQLFDRELPARWRSVSPTRAQAVLLGFATLGLVSSIAFYPALASQLSPQEAFHRYRQLRRPGQALAVLGQRPEAARFQGAPEARSLEDVEAAVSWLSTDAASARHWLVFRRSELAELNAHFRELSGRNLPVLDARSSEILLGSDRLAPGERDENPLNAFVLATPPRPQHPLHAVLDGKLEVLGWRVTTADGAEQREISPTQRYRFVTYYRVLAPLSGTWKAFLHIDGLQRRFNADHELLDGKYPLSLWRQNDLIADATEVALEPNFSSGPYRVYFGLFAGDRRLAVTEGPAQDDRIVAGTLQVR